MENQQAHQTYIMICHYRSCKSSTTCVWYVGRDGTERDEAFRPVFGTPKMGGTGCSTGQILSVFASHLPLERTNIPHVFFKNYTFVPSRSVPSHPVPFYLRTKRTLKEPQPRFKIGSNL
ncbi:hypothetical protein DVH24_041773 [Malus domestica]|uniref:Uncharacterized protein n=1 Tax=Malus domestica TaxID=3750 RepID=A0A498IS70_MALDO|nr:hypothetical protein DVH24_041773 [Malus domestica]